MSTLAGSVRGFKDGFGSQAQLNYPEGVTFDQVHRVLYAVEFVSACLACTGSKLMYMIQFTGQQCCENYQ